MSFGRVGPLVAPDLSGAYARFLIARQITLWHYQWLGVNEHLPQIAGQAVVSDVLARGNRFSQTHPGIGSYRDRVWRRGLPVAATRWSGPRTTRTSQAAPATAPARPPTHLRPGLRCDPAELQHPRRPRRPARRLPSPATLRRLADLL